MMERKSSNQKIAIVEKKEHVRQEEHATKLSPTKFELELELELDHENSVRGLLLLLPS